MNISIIEMPLFYGCDNPGVENGPKVLRENNLLDIFTKSHTVCDMGEVSIKQIDPKDKYAANDKMKYLDEVVRANIELANKVYMSLQNNSLPIVIGGDHSLALGSVAGTSKYYGEDLAVVWVDAHGDINTSKTTPSGNIHGMPLSGSMGLGDDSLINIYSLGRKVKPENVFILGARDLDQGELELIEEHKLNVWDIKYITKNGIDSVLKEFLEEIKKKGINHIHFSFDIDCLDPYYVPGTGTPVEDGLSFIEGKKVLETVIGTNLVTSIDFVEFNPALDKNNKTLETCLELLKIISNSLKNN
ncbi:arginase [Clostridium chauvoei]|uniref:Arginase n=2 Tax=Clostridium chauvoei TaxID=46867 RepID=A0A1U6J6Y3_9CLOT|nr:arginase [Clostridium chauvoei]ATD54739.1 arginase [Clostridium chauvoei]ATD57580.1 arginase [Clostridium chauvoei]MBX7280039.1 arginase [Clostridium chauvoei]MBX7282302.1 arginase [Clostridium chauvoei]MBX7284930.1 arginase [Clostridium chauvoei]